jgi:hypothetical protein
MVIGSSEGIDAGSEDGVKGCRRDGIEVAFEFDALATKQLPESTRRILATRDNLIVTSLKEGLMDVSAASVIR